MKTGISLLLLLFYLISSFCNISFAQTNKKPVVKRNIFFGKSKAIREAIIVLPGISTEMKEISNNPYPEHDFDISQITMNHFIPKNAQRLNGRIHNKGPILNFEGVGNVNNVWPADPNGDIGLHHYVQSVNNSTAVWDKNGELIFGPVDNQTFFESLPGPWHDIWWSDPIFVHDPIADRWVFTSMSLSNEQSMYYEMIAVSVGQDPLGEYYCYVYEFEYLNDYPKLSVWPNGYYITYNIFNWDGDWSFLYSLVTVLDRESMLAGQPEAAMIEFIVDPSSEFAIAHSPLTADFNGLEFPKKQSCPLLFAEYIRQGFPWTININHYEVMPDWEIPENSTMDSIALINVEGTFPFFSNTNAPQPGNFHDVETVNFFLMHPLAYRNFGNYEAMTTCQTLFDGNKHYIRWYEFRNDTTGWYTYQSGSYMPDSASRYMPSIAINKNGDIATVYTKSSLDVFPSIWLTGRRADDSLGLMTIEEIEIYRGLNYINNLGTDGRNRWGDYASIMVDPVNDTTFWLTSMYPKASTVQGNWGTRIAALNISETGINPLVNAGNDTSVCYFDPFMTNASAENYSYLLWESSGSGSFLNEHAMNTTYLRSNEDAESGEIKLKVQIEGNIPGTNAADSLTLYFQKAPEVEAGIGDTICLGQSFYCQGDASFTESYYWTSNGNGNFNDSTSLNAIYTPAESDTGLSMITLTLNAKPILPCAEIQSDNLFLFVRSCLGLEDYDENINLDIYPNPTSGLVLIEAEFDNSDQYKIMVIDNSGQIIFSGYYKNTSGLLEKKLDFTHLPSGAYFVNIAVGNKTATSRIIKR